MKKKIYVSNYRPVRASCAHGTSYKTMDYCDNNYSAVVIIIVVLYTRRIVAEIYIGAHCKSYNIVYFTQFAIK